MLNVECFRMTSAFAIDVRGVTNKFGDRTVVNDIAMQVRPGQPENVKLQQ
jgi:ABC-type transporter Mla maintaining outer membrane lipid asymmetry ATPase subunit MlaF